MTDVDDPIGDILHHIGDTPLVRLREREAGVEILAKCEHLNPGGSLKDRIALAIVEDAERRGALRPGGTIVEATGGNTGIGLAMVAAVKGYELVCVLSRKMSPDKSRALRLMGARVLITDDAPADDPRNFRRVAERLAEENGWHLADQFNNDANVRVHYERTADELIAQTGGRIAAFVAGVGTGGTISGVGRRLKERDPRVQVVLADPVGSRLAGVVETGELGPEDKYHLEGIGGSTVPRNFDPSVVDEAIAVPDEDAFAETLRLIREDGLLVGGSSGAVAVAARGFARSHRPSGPVVAMLGDSWDRYWSQPWMADVAPDDGDPDARSA